MERRLAKEREDFWQERLLARRFFGLFGVLFFETVGPLGWRLQTWQTQLGEDRREAQHWLGSWAEKLCLESRAFVENTWRATKTLKGSAENPFVQKTKRKSMGKEGGVVRKHEDLWCLRVWF